MKIPYKHQQKFINRNPDRALLVWEMQTGKTFAASLWLNKRKHLRAVVVCPKAIIGKWKRDLADDGAIADVISRDDIKKVDLDIYDVIVLDEAQDFASPIYDRGRSQRTTVLYNYFKKHKEAHVLCLSATPIRSTPWNIHTLAVYLGVYWDVRQFRDEFFHLTDRFGVMHYEKNKDWRIKIRPYLESISDIVLRRDVIDVPEEKHEVINIPWTKKQEESLSKQYLEPSAEFNERRRAEQGDAKWEKIKELIDGYRKVILVVYYRSQIDDYIKRIGDDRQVFVLSGSTKDQNKVIEDAKASDDCIFILQASMGAGFSAAEFSVMIFASMSYKYVDYIQATGRMNSLVDTHVNHYVYLLGGKTDRAVYDTIMKGHDFNPHQYLTRGITETDTEKGTESNPSSFEVVPGELPF